MAERLVLLFVVGGGNLIRKLGHLGLVPQQHKTVFFIIQVAVVTSTFQEAGVIVH